MNFSRLVLFFGTIIGSGAHAAPAVQLLNCWDGSFAYTRATVVEDPSQNNLRVITVETEQQPDFSQILTGPSANTMAGWGHVVVTMFVDKSECQSPAGRGDLMNCETKNGIISIQYDEDMSSRRILNLLVTDFKFQSSHVGNTVVVDLSYTSSSAKSPGGWLKTEFTANAAGICQNKMN